MKSLLSKMMSLYDMGVFQRSIIIWLFFQVLLWLVFGIVYLLNIDSWNQISELADAVSNPDSLLKTVLFIIGNNLFILLLIGLSNLFVRFGVITPGLLILVLQAVMIGFVAGSNSFEFPFSSVIEANIQYLKVGLWETTAYALMCGVTFTKSLNIADSFPAKQWSQVRKFKDIQFSGSERFLLLLSVLLIIISAYIEALLIM